MSLARRLLLRASRSSWLSRQLAERAFLRRAARRFMPGEDPDAALDAAAGFAKDGIGAVLTELGEQVTTAAAAQAVRDHYLELLDRIAERAIAAHISVKLTHLGLEVDRVACLDHLLALAARAERAGSFLWIDMEESRYVDATLELFRQVRAARERVGVCLQAYLRRTPADVEALLPLAPAIRLVKGAYNEPASVAFPRKRDVDAAYFALGARLLERAGPGGARPVFGTHDLRLLDRIRECAATLRTAPGAFEVHMLFGIRAAAQHALASAGVTVRVLISYGRHWFPWYMRRLAERPANVWFVVRHLV
ncbi:MAG TPA: proline dehydrogenase family protein [Gemmatimonadales bacterium]|jgi:proline dehydrogenase|nr:proline dehydrogenase family protein [Gemmatimonadales bacterium]